MKRDTLVVATGALSLMALAVPNFGFHGANERDFVMGLAAGIFLPMWGRAAGSDEPTVSWRDYVGGTAIAWFFIGFLGTGSAGLKVMICISSAVVSFLVFRNDLTWGSPEASGPSK